MTVILAGPQILDEIASKIENHSEAYAVYVERGRADF